MPFTEEQKRRHQQLLKQAGKQVSTPTLELPAPDLPDFEPIKGEATVKEKTEAFFKHDAAERELAGAPPLEQTTPGKAPGIEDLLKGVSGAASGASMGGPPGALFGFGINADPSMREQVQKNNPILSQFLVSDDPVPELGAQAVQEIFTKKFGMPGKALTLAGRTLAGAVGGAAGAFTDVAFGNKNMEEALDAVSRQAVGGFIGGSLGATQQALFGVDPSAPSVELLDNLKKAGFGERIKDQLGFAMKSGRGMAIRRFVGKTFGGGAPIEQEANRVAKAALATVKKDIQLNSGRQLLQRADKFDSKINPQSVEFQLDRVAKKMNEKIVSDIKKVQLANGSWKNKVIQRPVRAGDIVYVDKDTGKLLAFAPDYRSKFGKDLKNFEMSPSYQRITATRNLTSPRSFTAQELEQVNSLVKLNPGSFLEEFNPTKESNLQAFRSFSAVLGEEERKFFQRQALNKWVLDPAVKFDATGVHPVGDPKGRRITLDGNGLISALNAFGPEKFDQAFQPGSAQALLDIGELMRVGEFAEAFSQRAGESQLQYSANKGLFSLQSRAAVTTQGAGALGALGALGGMAAGVGATMMPIAAGFLAVIPVSRIVSEVLDNPAFADLLIEAGQGSAKAASLVLTQLASSGGDPRVQRVPDDNGKGKQALLLFEPPPDLSAQPKKEPNPIEQMLMQGMMN